MWWLLLLEIVLSSTQGYNSGGCHFPEHWKGRWFNLGFAKPLVISDNKITQKGVCVESATNQYVMEENDGDSGKCYRCMVIYEKHFNVLQYKESFCEEDYRGINWLCEQIGGDSSLHSMFRKDAESIKCPFRGPYSFSYAKGGSYKTCSDPPSYMDSCVDSTRVKLRYQACTDVPGSEIANEEIECLGHWKQGSSRYLVAMLNHSHVYTDEDRYRCFVYQRHREKDHVTYKMAQSYSASCLGLWIPTEGSNIYNMKKLDNDNQNNCVFPTWMSHHHEWFSINQEAGLHLNKKGHTLKLRNFTSGLSSVVTCHSMNYLAESNSVQIITHVKAGCDSGYVCMVFHGRDRHVIQMQYGDKGRHPSEACSHYHFDSQFSPILTFVSGLHHRQPCPFSGLYTISGGALLPQVFRSEGTCREDSSMFMYSGCSGSSHVRIEYRCPESSVIRSENSKHISSEFNCHVQWPIQDNYQALILSSSAGGKKDYLCLTYLENSDGVITASLDQNACLVNSVKDIGTFNVTSSGPCLEALTGSDTSSSSSRSSSIFEISEFALLLLSAILYI